MHLYALALQHPDDLEHGHGEAVLRTMSPPGANVRDALERLADKGLARRTEAGLWTPSAVGRRRAERILKSESGGEL